MAKLLAKKMNYAELVGYVGFAQLCGSAPIMCKIMHAHNHKIPTLATVYFKEVH